MKTYQILARALGAKNRCDNSGNEECSEKWNARINELMEAFPHGSGFDNGTQLDDSSTPEKLVFNTAFHHMDDNGMYCGWTQHQVIVIPSLEMGYRIRITGRNVNQIKELMYDDFNLVLEAEQPEYAQETH